MSPASTNMKIIHQEGAEKESEKSLGGEKSVTFRKSNEIYFKTSAMWTECNNYARALCENVEKLAERHTEYT